MARAFGIILSWLHLHPFALHNCHLLLPASWSHTFCATKISTFIISLLNECITIVFDVTHILITPQPAIEPPTFQLVLYHVSKSLLS